MTVNTECGLLLTYVPTYRNARASEGRRCRACTVWSPLASSGGHPRRAACTVDAAQHADARRRVARVRAPVSRPPPRFKGAQARAQARAQGLRRELRASGRQARAQGRSWPCSCSQARREALLIVVASIQECAAGRHILGSDPNLLAPPPLPSCSRSRTTTPFPKPHTHTPQPTPPSLRVFTRSICGTRSVVPSFG
jgi:hypothetical protein